MDLADTGARLRPGTGQTDEAFRKSLASLSQLLASRPPDPPVHLPDIEFFGSRDEATAFRRHWATAVFLLVAAIAAVSAGIYSFVRAPSHEGRSIETVAAPAPPPAVATPAVSTPAFAPPVISNPKIVPPPPDPASSPSVGSSVPKTTVSSPLDAKGISELQTRLGRLGFSPGTIDGVAGPLTAAALRRFQQSRGLPQTGNADTGTLEQLRKEPAR